jgi:hypothetical protein
MRAFRAYFIIDLGLYRIKTHCNYDPAATGTTDFSVFQVEILDERLRGFYKGQFLLEVWNKAGERLFQKVLKSEIRDSQWELNANTLVFKSDCDPEFVYVMFLAEGKMTALKHAYIDHQGKKNSTNPSCRE